LIKKMLVEHHDSDPERIEWLPSKEGTTINSALVARQYLHEHGIEPKERTVEFCTSFYHCVRSSRVALRGVGLPPLLTPAEAFTIAEAILLGTQQDAEDQLRSYGGHLCDQRIIKEIRGIAQDLLDAYRPETVGW